MIRVSLSLVLSAAVLAVFLGCSSSTQEAPAIESQFNPQITGAENISSVMPEEIGSGMTSYTPPKTGLKTAIFNYEGWNAAPNARVSEYLEIWINNHPDIEIEKILVYHTPEGEMVSAIVFYYPL